MKERQVLEYGQAKRGWTRLIALLLAGTVLSLVLLGAAWDRWVWPFLDKKIEKTVMESYKNSHISATKVAQQP